MMRFRCLIAGDPPGSTGCVPGQRYIEKEPVDLLRPMHVEHNTTSMMRQILMRQTPTSLRHFVTVGSVQTHEQILAIKPQFSSASSVRRRVKSPFGDDGLLLFFPFMPSSEYLSRLLSLRVELVLRRVARRCRILEGVTGYQGLHAGVPERKLALSLASRLLNSLVVEGLDGVAPVIVAIG